MSPLQAVIFDLDDTLYPEWQYVRSGYRAAASHLRDKLGRQDAFDDWLWERFRSGRREAAFDALGEHFQLHLRQQDIAELVEVYRNHRPDIRCFDGLAGLLTRLGGRFRLGLLSDGFLPAQRLKLAALGLERRFEAVVFTEEMGRHAWKPSPAGFVRIAGLLGAPGRACAYVADNPAKDFVAPNALGWLTIQYVQPGQLHSSAPGPDGGRPQAVARLPGELLAALG